MNRGYVALGVGAAVVAGFVLYIVLGSHDDAATPQPTSHRPAGPRNFDQRPSRPPPTAPGTAPPAADPAGSGNDGERTLGNVVVRDHRTGDHPEMDLPPKMNAPGGRKIPSALTFDISQRLRPLVTECGGKNIPADARGAKAHVEGQIQIAIKDHQASVTHATFQMRDVTGDFDAVKACLEQKSVGVMAPAADEADLTTYSITTSLRLP